MTFDLDPLILQRSVIAPSSLMAVLNLAASTPFGCFVELGVYRGGSAWHLAKVARDLQRSLHLFDTFTGIPEQSVHDLQHKIGDFGNTDLADVIQLIPDAIFHVGVFPETMCDLGPIGFAHIDCDQYLTCLAAIQHFLPLLVHGGIMLFDDYNATSGVTKAVDDVFGDRIELTADRKAWFQRS